MDSFGTLLGSTFMPHGFCLRWLPGLLWTHVVADALIAIAYFSIPISILYYLSRRSTRGEAEGQSEMVQRYWWIGVMFAAFILCCGITHIFGMVTIWQPVYGLQALLKAVTAVVSLLTAAALIRMTPQLLALRTAEELEAEISRRQERETELERANARLRNEMASRQRAEDAERAAVRAFRELEEETGTTRAEILAESADWLHYDLPAELVGKLWKGRYRGQTQKWFAMRFRGEDADIDIETEEPEFSDWQWAAPERLPELIVPFKRDLYRRVLEEFRPLLTEGTTL